MEVHVAMVVFPLLSSPRQPSLATSGHQHPTSFTTITTTTTTTMATHLRQLHPTTPPPPIPHKLQVRGELCYIY